MPNTFRRLSPEIEDARRARMNQQMKRTRLEYRWFTKARFFIKQGSPRAKQWVSLYTKIFGCGQFSQMLQELLES